MFSRKHSFSFILLAVALSAAFFSSCSRTGTNSSSKPPFDIAVFVPGSVSGEPMLDMMVRGARKAAEKYRNATVTVVEGERSKSEWTARITSLVKTGQYSLIVTTGPELGVICGAIAAEYPLQNFLALDAYVRNVPNVYSVLYNRREQTFLLGYLGGLLLTQDSAVAKSGEKKVGMLISDETAMEKLVVRKAFDLGLRTVDPSISLDVRLLGNRYDTAKAAQIAGEMINSGARLILPLVGAANSGAVTAAKDRKAHLLWLDGSGYREAPGIVLGSATIDQETVTTERTQQAIEGKLKYGTAEIDNVSDGTVGLDDSDPLYRKYVPEPIRKEIARMVARLKSGEFRLQMPTDFEPAQAAKSDTAAQ